MSRHEQMTAGGSALPAPVDGASGDVSPAGPGSVRPVEIESSLAGQVQDYLAGGNDHAARDLFAQIVTRQQRRASRIAWHYLRDVADADEAVQDAFVKAYTHIASFQRHLSFEVWLTRILINGCLDRQKARTRRSRWLLPAAIRTPSSTPRGRPIGRPKRSSWRGSGATSSSRPCSGCPIVSASCSCCAITPTIRRATSPR